MHPTHKCIAASTAVLLLFLTSALPAQGLLITEVHTGTPDFVEVTNVGATAVPVTGWGLMIADPTSCPAWETSPQVNGPYVSGQTTMIPPGGSYVFEEGGTAGAPISAGLGGAGEQLGFDLSWSEDSHAEVALYSGAALTGAAFEPIAGTAEDYVQFLTSGIGVEDGFRYNPPGVGGLWLSGPVVRAPDDHAVFRAAGNADSDTNTDWGHAENHSAGASSAAAGNQVLTPGLDLSIVVQPGFLEMVVTSGSPAMPFTELYNVATLQPQGCAGDGDVLGMPVEIWPQFLLPLGYQPFHVLTDGAGRYQYNNASNVVPGLMVQVRSFLISGNTVAVLSDFVFFTTN